MSAFVRWCRFNLVGAMGTGVQFAVLAALSRLAPEHYLLASSGAIEVTVLHNFCWHLRFTWKDRSNGATGTRLLRFQMTNGAVSLGGNLLLMRLLVGRAHLPVLAANAVAVLGCGLLNFALAERWIWAEASRS